MLISLCSFTKFIYAYGKSIYDDVMIFVNIIKVKIQLTRQSTTMMMSSTDNITCYLLMLLGCCLFFFYLLLLLLCMI